MNRSRDFAMRWREHVQNEGSAIRMKLLNPKLESMIGDIKGKRVLDIGCGEGFSTKLLTGKGAEVIGADVNPHSAGFAAVDIKEADFLVANMDGLPFIASSFDLILCCNVLMNSSEDEVKDGVMEWQRVLAPQGRIIATIMHPIYSLFGNGFAGKETGQVRCYGLNEEIRVDTIAGFMDFVEYRRPLAWYAKAFAESGFYIGSFDEVFVSWFEGIDEKHEKRLGLPIFAVFELQAR
jgi:SAM-dependent methyltransferase